MSPDWCRGRVNSRQEAVCRPVITPFDIILRCPFISSLVSRGVIRWDVRYTNDHHGIVPISYIFYVLFPEEAFKKLLFFVLSFYLMRVCCSNKYM